MTSSDRRRPEDVGQWLRGQAYLIVAGGMLAGGLLLTQRSSEDIDWFKLLGTTLISTGLISVSWRVVVDRWQKKSVVEAMQKALGNIDPRLGLEEERIGDIETRDLEEMLKNCNEASLTCLFDKRWTDPWSGVIANWVKGGGHLRFCAPDPHDGPLMRELAHRHSDRNPADFRNDVRALLNRFSSLAKEAGKGHVEVRTTAGPGPAYTSYLFSKPGRRGAGITRMYEHVMNEEWSLVEQTFREDGRLFRHHHDSYDRLWQGAKPWPEAAPASRRPRIGVIGPGDVAAGSELYAMAESVGALLAQEGADIVCGGLGGVMEAVAIGASAVRSGRANPSVSIYGYLPGLDVDDANLGVTHPVATGKGEGRDIDVVLQSDAIVAVGWNEGTLIEALLAKKTSTVVVGLAVDPVMVGDRPLQLAMSAESAQDAVDKALAAAAQARQRSRS